MIIVRRDGSSMFSTRTEALAAASDVRQIVSATHMWVRWKRNRKPGTWIGKDGVATWMVQVEGEIGLWSVCVHMTSPDARTVRGLCVPIHGSPGEVVAEVNRRRRADVDAGAMWEDAELSA